MRDAQFLKGLAVGLGMTVVFMGGRLSAEPVQATANTTRIANALEAISKRGIALRTDTTSSPIKVEDDLKNDLAVRLRDDSVVKVEPKWSSFPVAIKE